MMITADSRWMIDRQIDVRKKTYIFKYIYLHIYQYVYSYVHIHINGGVFIKMFDTNPFSCILLRKKTSHL